MAVKTNALNILALLVAAPLLGYSLAHSGPQSLVSDAQAMLSSASVGMSVGVAANPYNTLAVELNKKEVELEERESMLQKSQGGDNYGAYSLIMSAVLLLLVAINFYLDFRRRSAQRISRYAIDLR